MYYNNGLDALAWEEFWLSDRNAPNLGQVSALFFECPCRRLFDLRIVDDCHSKCNRGEKERKKSAGEIRELIEERTL